jgi:hypothetical protein
MVEGRQPHKPRISSPLRGEGDHPKDGGGGDAAHTPRLQRPREPGRVQHCEAAEQLTGEVQVCAPRKTSGPVVNARD